MTYQDNRRTFIKQLGLTGLGLVAAPGSILKLKTLAAAAADNSLLTSSGQYKALVCLYFDGGNDSFNMLMPRGSAYNDYADIRSNLAIRQSDMQPINPSNSVPSLGLHPRMGDIAQLFDDGKLSFLSNIGMLIEPVTKENYYSESTRLPLGLFSHLDQTIQWQTASPHVRDAKGWAGKIADLMMDVNNNDKISMNFALNNTNVFQSGNQSVQFVINSNGARGLTGYGDRWGVAPIRNAAIDSILQHNYQDPFQNNYTDIFRTAVEANVEFERAIDEMQPLQTEFSEDNLSRRFRMIARSIAVREALGFNRQIFFVRLGGFDTHDELLGRHGTLMRQTNDAIFSFQSALEELGVQDDVITFTMSEFGRTLTSNGNGTDHAWGGNLFVLGGAVNGNRVFGTYPDLAMGSNLMVDGSALIPTTATDLYFAELALWFGVSRSDLPLLFPNLSNFYDINSSDLPIGFLNI